MPICTSSDCISASSTPSAPAPPAWLLQHTIPGARCQGLWYTLPICTSSYCVTASSTPRTPRLAPAARAAWARPAAHPRACAGRYCHERGRVQPQQCRKLDCGHPYALHCLRGSCSTLCRLRCISRWPCPLGQARQLTSAPGSRQCRPCRLKPCLQSAPLHQSHHPSIPAPASLL